jgi:hypothetical protein
MKERVKLLSPFLREGCKEILILERTLFVK